MQYRILVVPRCLRCLTEKNNVVIISNMKASRLFTRRVIVCANAFADLVLWKLSQPILGSTHSYKYRLAFVVSGVCVLRYDNEAGKSDHKHIGDAQAPYTFTTPMQLVVDFWDDVKRWQDENRYTGSSHSG